MITWDSDDAAQLTNSEWEIVERFADRRALTGPAAIRRLVLAGLAAEGVVLPPDSLQALRTPPGEGQDTGETGSGDLRADSPRWLSPSLARAYRSSER